MAQQVMALVSLSFKFFRDLETALEAVKNGDARLSAFLLKSIKQGGSLLQQHTALLRDQLNESEKEYQQKVEILTRDMNELYKQEEDIKKKKEELERKKHLLVNERELCSRKKEDARRRYQETEKEMKEAERKMKEFHGGCPFMAPTLFFEKFLIPTRQSTLTRTKRCKDMQETWREPRQTSHG